MNNNFKKGELVIYRSHTFVVILEEVKYDLPHNKYLTYRNKQVFETYTCLFPYGKDTVSGVYLNSITRNIL